MVIITINVVITYYIHIQLYSIGSKLNTYFVNYFHYILNSTDK